MYVHTNTWTRMFIAALFIRAKKWKPHTCLSAGKQRNKMWYICAMEYHLAIKRKPTNVNSRFIGKDWWWERLRHKEKGAAEDETVGSHHRFDGHELGQTPGNGETQGGLGCCNPWGHKESDTTEQLNSNSKKEGRVDTTYDVDEPWKHHAKWKKSVIKDHIVGEPRYTTCPEQANPWR